MNVAPPPIRSSPPGAAPPPGFSQFVAKVLDQLSLSAWLPGIVFTIGLALGTTLLRQEQLDLAQAVRDLSGQPVAVVVVMTFGVVVVTMTTQAFEFHFIRLLEGYWGDGLVGRAASRWLIDSKIGRRRRLREREERLRRRMLGEARVAMLDDDIERSHVDAFEDLVGGRELANEELHERAELLEREWLDYTDPADARALEALDAQLRSFPVHDSRFLPTRLGNTLRSFEQHLPDGAHVEGFVMHTYEHLDDRLAEQHSQHRTRLDMYCTLTFVFVALALLWGAAALAWQPWQAALIGSAVLASLAWISYWGAIAAAQGYGAVLLELAARVRDSTR